MWVHLSRVGVFKVAASAAGGFDLFLDETRLGRSGSALKCRLAAEKFLPAEAPQSRFRKEPKWFVVNEEKPCPAHGVCDVSGSSVRFPGRFR